MRREKQAVLFCVPGIDLKAVSKAFFFEKKKQKAFASAVVDSSGKMRDSGVKKELLSCDTSVARASGVSCFRQNPKISQQAAPSRPLVGYRGSVRNGATAEQKFLGPFLQKGTACLALPVFALLTLAGCDDMIHQPKKNPYADRSVGPGATPRNTVDYHARLVAPPPVTLALIQRGQQRYHIYCTPCHSELGDGRGMIVQRGFPHPPSYHTARLRNVAVAHIYDVITNGYGAMYSFAYRVQPEDRWAIAAYIRALQRSQDATVADLTPAQKAALP